EVYLVPRRGGHILVGATVEHVGYSKEVTTGAVNALLTAAIGLIPDLRDARFVRAWAGLRPGTADGLPILGASPVRGLFLATGHYRNGILLAPVTAQRMADLILRGEAGGLTPFSIDRFRPSVDADRAEQPRSGVFG